MKHGFYPRSHPSYIGTACSDSTQSTQTTYRTRRMPDRSDYLEDIVLSDYPSSDGPIQSWRPSLAYAADQRRFRNTHSRTSHRQPNSLRNARKRRSLSKDSNNTTPSPSPSRSPLNLDFSYDHTPPVDPTAGPLYRPLLAPFLEPEPYPMPDYAEDTVIYPLEMPEFDYDIFSRSCADDL